ncbi:mpv17 pmp22 family protein [Cystoisospora suis]|uniref:Mpv17 pmp22 family protein n=1 Tax=Cystoisospora suis TaxID=483139 RepID=A0A2C6KQS3_9APIC|nr:mpv17 pmp22 family protein [Cystoisospora suis]
MTYLTSISYAFSMRRGNQRFERFSIFDFFCFKPSEKRRRLKSGNFIEKEYLTHTFSKHRQSLSASSSFHFSRNLLPSASSLVSLLLPSSPCRLISRHCHSSLSLSSSSGSPSLLICSQETSRASSFLSNCQTKQLLSSSISPSKEERKNKTSNGCRSRLSRLCLSFPSLLLTHVDTSTCSCVNEGNPSTRISPKLPPSQRNRRPSSLSSLSLYPSSCSSISYMNKVSCVSPFASFPTSLSSLSFPSFSSSSSPSSSSLCCISLFSRTEVCMRTCQVLFSPSSSSLWCSSSAVCSTRDSRPVQCAEGSSNAAGVDEDEVKKSEEDSLDHPGDGTKKRCRDRREEKREKEKEEEKGREAERGQEERRIAFLSSPCTSQKMRKTSILRSDSTERERKNRRKGEGGVDESGFFSSNGEGSYEEMAGAREMKEKKKVENFFFLRYLLVLSYVKRVSEKVLLRLRHPIADREKMKKDIFLNSICALMIYALSDLAAQKLQRIVKELEEKEATEKQQEEETRRNDETVKERKASMYSEKNVGCILESGYEEREDEKEERRMMTTGERRLTNEEEEKKEKRMMEQSPSSTDLHDGDVKGSSQRDKMEEDKKLGRPKRLVGDIAQEEEKGDKEEKAEESRESSQVEKKTEKDRLLTKEEEEVDWRRTVSLALEGFLINGIFLTAFYHKLEVVLHHNCYEGDEEEKKKKPSDEDLHDVPPVSNLCQVPHLHDSSEGMKNFLKEDETPHSSSSRQAGSALVCPQADVDVGGEVRKENEGISLLRSLKETSPSSASSVPLLTGSQCQSKTSLLFSSRFSSDSSSSQDSSSSSSASTLQQSKRQIPPVSPSSSLSCSCSSPSALLSSNPESYPDPVITTSSSSSSLASVSHDSSPSSSSPSSSSSHSPPRRVRCRGIYRKHRSFLLWRQSVYKVLTGQIVFMPFAAVIFLFLAPVLHASLFYYIPPSSSSIRSSDPSQAAIDCLRSYPGGGQSPPSSMYVHSIHHLHHQEEKEEGEEQEKRKKKRREKKGEEPYFSFFPWWFVLACLEGIACVRTSFKEIYISSCYVWPLSDLINFRFIPLRYRPLWDSTLDLFWTIYLSAASHPGEMKERLSTAVILGDEREREDEEEVLKDSQQLRNKRQKGEGEEEWRSPTATISLLFHAVKILFSEFSSSSSFSSSHHSSA